MNGLVPAIEKSLIEEQLSFEQCHYLTFPLPSKNILIVNSLATLAIARSVLLAPFNSEDADDIRFVGIDSEWYASARKPAIYPGASILQVGTLF